MDYLDKFKQYLKQEALDPVGKEDDDIDRFHAKKSFSNMYSQLSFSYGKHVPEDDDFQKKLR